MTALERFGKNVRTLVACNGWKMTDFEVNMVGLSPGYISRVAAGKSRLSLQKGYEIAKVLDISIESLMENDFYLSNKADALRAEIKALTKELKEIERSE